jgi:hypothetical protein
MQLECVYKCIAIGFILGSLLQIMIPKNDKQFKKALTPQQKQTYENIVKERVRIFMFAWVCSLLFIWQLPITGWSRSIVYHLMLGAIYECTPKSTYMVEHLHNQTQIRLWQKVYTQMQFRTAIALLVNILFIPFICGG